MKKTILLVLLSPLIVLACLVTSSVASARGYNFHHLRKTEVVNHSPTPAPKPTPAPTPTPVPTPTSTLPSSDIQFGMFNNGKETQYGTITGFFIGDGDSLSEDVASLKISGPLFVYWESNLTALQIEEGQADSYLKSWAAQMKSYGQSIIFAPLDEFNGDWSKYYGQTGTFQAAWIHIHSLFASDANVKFSYDPNVCGPGIPCSTLTAYYPGSAYVDYVGLDGFDFGGQTWAQVFDASIPAMQSLGKPLWITAEGAVNSDNQSAFLDASFAAPVQGIMYFNAPGNGGNFTLTSSALGTLKTLL